MCDFNLSGTDEILEDSLHGTVFYMSPEIIQNGLMSEKSDFWSLGVLTFFLFFKKFPFYAKNRSELFFKIVNRIFEPEIFSAKNNLKKFIFDLLNLDFKKRLGNNLFEFLEHPFFFGFDWNKIFFDKFEFSFNLEKLKSFKGKASGESFLEIERDVKRNLKFLNIYNFSFSEKSVVEDFKKI